MEGILLLSFFVIGVLLVVFGVLFIFFPRVMDDLSAWTSQVIINFEDLMQKGRRPFGVLLFLFGVWIIWYALTTRNHV
jgi:hypothetical protein